MVLQSAEQVIGRVEAYLREVPQAVLAFDGDGTFWTGDVGDDFLDAMLRGDRIRPEAGQALFDVAKAHGVALQGDAGMVVRRLLDQEKKGLFPEKLFFELTAWLCAGWTASEVDGFVDDVLESGGLDQRLHGETLRVARWAMDQGIDVYVVSASPRPVVEKAALRVGVAKERVVALTPVFEGGIMKPRAEEPVPYGEGKVQALAAVTGGRPVAAAFGDNFFDIPLLQAAQIPVAVRPKERLRAGAARVPGMVELVPEL